MEKRRTMYQVVAPPTPGAMPHVVAETNLLRNARLVARGYEQRKDLRGQDVRIQRRDGQLVEYAGPNR